MLATLDAVVQRLISAYDPERIILFGSHATGEAREGSDIDLLAETPPGSIGRDLRAIGSHGVAPLRKLE